MTDMPAPSVEPAPRYVCVDCGCLASPFVVHAGVCRCMPCWQAREKQAHVCGACKWWQGGAATSPDVYRQACAVLSTGMFRRAAPPNKGAVYYLADAGIGTPVQVEAFTAAYFGCTEWEPRP